MNECTVDVEFEVTFKNDEDEIITETITVELDAMCDSWNEYCHGCHEVSSVSDESVEVSIEHFLENYTLDDIQYHIVGNEVKEIIDIKEV